MVTILSPYASRNASRHASRHGGGGAAGARRGCVALMLSKSPRFCGYFGKGLDRNRVLFVAFTSQGGLS